MRAGWLCVMDEDDSDKDPVVGPPLGLEWTAMAPPGGARAPQYTGHK